jgi:signal transduction histidine kinase
MDAIAMTLAALAGAAASAVLVRARIERGTGTAGRAAEDARRELRPSAGRSPGGRDVEDLILSSMRDGVLLVDAGGSPLFANAALGELLGDVPAGTSALFPLALRDAVEHALTDRTETSAVAEVPSSRRWLHVTAAPVGDDGSVLVVVRDVTEARRVDAIRRDFVANASHELKTPAASIQATAEAIGRAAAGDPEAVGPFAARLELEAARLSRIVTDLLDLSRLEAGSELEDEVRLDQVARDEVARFGERAERDGIALAIDATHPAPVRGNARDLALLVRNLVDNALRYTEPGGSVDVAVSVGDAVTLRVSDTGLGIPHRDLPRVFERFYRVDRARSRETGGTGLGLAIVRHVAENLGGTVSIDSELGAGTTFEVSLPRSSA